MCSLDGQRPALDWLHNSPDASLSVHYSPVGGGYFLNMFGIAFCTAAAYLSGVSATGSCRKPHQTASFDCGSASCIRRSALFHDRIFGVAPNRIYELVFAAKSDKEAGTCVPLHLLQSLCLQSGVNCVFKGMFRVRSQSDS